MLALSIQQPHAWLILHAGKTIENRTWMTHERGLIAIHAPRKVDAAFFFRDDLYTPNWEQLPDPAIWKRAPQRKADFQTGGIVGVAELVDIVYGQRVRNPWFVGPYGWVLQKARPVPFVPYPGRLGLFQVPDRLIVLE